jgi:ABC-type transport system involved in multi-copper enzyme maturation permease subunit
MGPILVIAKITLQEGVRKKAVLGGVLLATLFLVLYGLGMYFVMRDLQVPESFMNPDVFRDAVAGQLLASALNVAGMLTALVAIFTAAGAIATEVEQNTLHAIIPKPLARWQVLVGKCCGLGTMSATFAAGTTLALLVLTWLFAGFFSWSSWQSALLLALLGILLTCVTVCASTLLSTLTAGVTVIMLYGLGLVGGMVEQLGVLLDNQVMQNIGIITSLILPSDALWRMSAQRLGVQEFAGLAGGPFEGFSQPSAMMLVWALIYITSAVLIGARVFGRKDL